VIEMKRREVITLLGGAREDQRWVWSVFGILANPPGMETNGRAPTLGCMPQKQSSKPTGGNGSGGPSWPRFAPEK
jgi:hypothetical protein